MASSKPDEDKIRQWVKDHKRELVDEFFAGQTVKQAGSGRAIFMAGIPGAGKTEFVGRMARRPGFDYVVIEHDKLVELINGYKAEHYYAYRQAGSALVTEILKRCLNQGLSFVFDTTLAGGPQHQQCQEGNKPRLRGRGDLCRPRPRVSLAVHQGPGTGAETRYQPRGFCRNLPVN